MVTEIRPIEDRIVTTELTPNKVLPKTTFKPGNKVGITFKKLPIVADLTTQSYFAQVPVNKLFIDPAYQRPLDTHRVSKMAHSWDQDRLGAIVVNVRANARLAVIDGQQRIGALRLMENTPEFVYAQVFEGLSVEQEAALFYELDTKRRSLTQTALFKALLASNDVAATEIAAAAHSVGLTADPTINGSVKNNLRAYGTLLKIHRRVGKAGLTKILRIAAKAWPDNTYWGAGNILLGLEYFIGRYPNAKEAHLIEVLSRVTPHMIENRARTLQAAMSSALGKWVARVMLSLYNAKMKKNRLPDWEA